MPASNPSCINSGGAASRILLPAVPVLDQAIEIGGKVLDALKTWRARPGEIFTVCDPAGQEYRARVTSLTADAVTLLPFAATRPTESPVRIQLLQALPEKERFELILQKGTEIGVSRIVPFTCQRSISLEERDAGQKKSHRWPEVLLRAARQCRRAEIPELYPVVGWEQALGFAATADLALVCYESAVARPVTQLLQNFTGSNLALIIGPEGGFSREEIQLAQEYGVQPISLGPRILRTETAAILAVGVMQFALGDLGCR